MRSRTVVLVAMLAMAPLSGQTADLVVWWDEGYYPEEHKAVEEIVTTFEQDTGKQVELVFHEESEHAGAIRVALEAGQPPDFAFGLLFGDYVGHWAFDDQLVDLLDAVGHFSDMFDPDALDREQLLNAATGQKALYGLPMGRTTNYVHVWKGLLERAGFTLADIPKEWDAFWSFWCDEVQPLLRKSVGSDDIWGVGLSMGIGVDTQNGFFQFMAASDGEYVTRDGRLVIDDPTIRRKLIAAVDDYLPEGLHTARRGGLVHRRPQQEGVPRARRGDDREHVALDPERAQARASGRLYNDAATIEWPLGPSGEAFPIIGDVIPAVVFKRGSHVASAKEFIRFLVAEGWLMHYLNFSAERMLPPMQKLLDQPFWLDPSDPHRMAGVMQISSRSMQCQHAQVSGDWRYGRVWEDWTWAKAIHRVAAEGISPEQAVDEAIARVKQILSE